MAHLERYRDFTAEKAIVHLNPLAQSRADIPPGKDRPS
jgi:hypothetical protein